MDFKVWTSGIPYFKLAQWVKNPTGSMKMWDLSLALLSGLWIKM